MALIKTGKRRFGVNWPIEFFADTSINVDYCLSIYLLLGLKIATWEMLKYKIATWVKLIKNLKIIDFSMKK